MKKKPQHQQQKACLFTNPSRWFGWKLGLQIAQHDKPVLQGSVLIISLLPNFLKEI